MLKSFLTFFAAILKMLRYPLYALFAFVALLGASCVIWAIRYGKQLKTREKSAFRPLEKRALWKRIFIDAPKMFVLDRVNAPSNFFPVHGLVIFEGRQGSGKTSSMVHYIHDLQYQYSRALCTTNFGYTAQDKPLEDWRDLVHYKNGYEGVIVAIDELQNWFSCKQSANFPPEMLSVVTQNRKNRRVILGTAQNFYMLAKDIRTQCTEIRRCMTIGGVFTIVHRVRPICNSAGDVEKYEHIGFYCWVHTPEERESYDTYKAIENISASGFIERSKDSFVSVLPVPVPVKK